MGSSVTRSPQHHARYQYALSHPQPIAVEGRLIQGVGYGLLLVAPFWLVVGVVVVLWR